jgi:hypothetical protein
MPTKKIRKVMGRENANTLGQSAGPGPEDGSERSNRRTQLTVAIISALAAVIVALIYVKPWQHPNPCRANLTITSPNPGQHVDGAHGVEVTGRACNMSGLTGWLFDYGVDDEHYYMDYSTNSTNNAEPIIVNNGRWAYHDGPMGTPGDRNRTYGITVVLASTTCTKELELAKPDTSRNIKFKRLPSGCKVEDSVNVDVTYR